MQTVSQRSEARKLHFDYRPTIFDPPTAIPGDFLDFLLPLHKEFTPWEAGRAKLKNTGRPGR